MFCCVLSTVHSCTVGTVAIICLSQWQWSNHEYYHDNVIKWKHFPHNWPFVQGIHRSPVNSPHKGQWSWALMFSLICVWINGWVNNGEAGDLKRHRAHYDVIVMWVHGSIRNDNTTKTKQTTTNRFAYKRAIFVSMVCCKTESHKLCVHSLCDSVLRQTIETNIACLYANAIRCQEIGPDGAKALPEPLLSYCEGLMVLISQWYRIYYL